MFKVAFRVDIKGVCAGFQAADVELAGLVGRRRNFSPRRRKADADARTGRGSRGQENGPGYGISTAKIRTRILDEDLGTLRKRSGGEKKDQREKYVRRTEEMLCVHSFSPPARGQKQNDLPGP